MKWTWKVVNPKVVVFPLQRTLAWGKITSRGLTTCYLYVPHMKAMIVLLYRMAFNVCQYIWFSRKSWKIKSILSEKKTHLNFTLWCASKAIWFHNSIWMSCFVENNMIITATTYAIPESSWQQKMDFNAFPVFRRCKSEGNILSTSTIYMFELSLWSVKCLVKHPICRIIFIYWKSM
jgi:hypothetical protein